MACGCKKNNKEKKEPSKNVNSSYMHKLIRKKIIEQIQKGNPSPKTPQ